MRIDTLNAEIVPAHQMAETPEILKILFRGTKADLGVVERVRAKQHPTLETLWRAAAYGGLWRAGRDSNYHFILELPRTDRVRPQEQSRLA